MNKGDISKTDRIIAVLGQQIVEGRFRPGSALPAETELAEEFGTSRNIMREALRALQVKRLVAVERYRGAFVNDRGHWNYLDSDVLQWALAHHADPRLITAMNEVRNLVEPSSARWAAERATSIDLVEIEAALNDMYDHHQDREAFNTADIRFHLAILKAVHNPILLQLGVAISSLLSAVFERTYMPDEGNMPRTLAEHRVLYDAIRRQDAEGAAAAAMTLINSAGQRLKDLDLT